MSLSSAPADRLARALASLEGLSVGDAFGERFFGPAAEDRIATRALPPAPWRWTDDTAMALSLVEVLRDRGRIERDDLAAAYARRYSAEPDRGYGGTAHRILSATVAGEPWREVARAPFGGTGSMGNGAAMRVAPLGAYFADDPGRVAAEAMASAEPTHMHPEGQAGAIAVALAAAWACRPAREAGDLFEAVLAQVPAGATREGIERAAEVPPTQAVQSAVALLGNGSQVIAPDTVPFCLWAVARCPDDYPEALWATVSGLGDRDTTCAIVGGVLGGRLGVEAIPAAWRRAREALPLR